MCKANQYRTGKTTKKRADSRTRHEVLPTKQIVQHDQREGNLERDYISVTGQDVKRRISPAVSINSPVLEDRVTYTPACISLKASVLNKNKINTRLQISRYYPHEMFSFFIFFFLPLNLRDETTTTIGKSATDKTWAISVLYAFFVINPYRKFNQLTCPLTASSKDNMIIWGTCSLCKFPGMSVPLHRQSGSLQTSGEHGWAGPRLRRFTAAPVVPLTQNRSKANTTFAGRFIIILGFGFCDALLCFK